MKTTTSPFIFCYGILLSLSFNHVQAFGLLQLSQATPIPPPQLLRGPDAIVTQASRPHHYFSHRSTLMEHVVLWTLAPESPQGIIATPDQVKTALRNPQTVLLDARTDEEIITGGFLSIPGHRWIHASCTKEDCPLLAQTAESQLPDKNVPVVAYCGTGKRAAQAVKTLQNKGYLQVLNAGAYSDLDYLKALR